MIFLRPEDLTSQEGMERAFRDYPERVRIAFGVYSVKH